MENWSQLERLAKDYVSSKNKDTLNEIIKGIYPYAKLCANRLLRGSVVLTINGCPRRYSERGNNIHEEDLIQKGVIKLAKYIYRYDPQKSFKTYAKIVLISGMATYSLNFRYFTAHSGRRRNEVNRNEQKFFSGWNYEPLDVKVKEIKQDWEELLFSEEEAEEIDYIFEGKNPEENVNTQEMNERVRTNLAALSSRRELVLQRKYFDGDTEIEIGKDLELTRERIRQIKEVALRELREYLLRRRIDDYKLSE